MCRSLLAEYYAKGRTPQNKYGVILCDYFVTVCLYTDTGRLIHAAKMLFVHTNDTLRLVCSCCVLRCVDGVAVLSMLQILEVMLDDNIALCLSPQGFSNVNPKTDIFNNTNQQFWE